ncbi:MAG: ABC transporter ATP-binding protein [Methanomassiliicoccales archaeon]|nr:MAG: ABC transporter ATP-binding protein [Methanomassiliicoccales archaeon]
MHAFTVKILDLWKTYDGQRQILNGVSLTVEPEETILIRGRSGSGKTTLLSIIGCIDTPTKGSILLNGYDASKLSQKELAKIRLKRIGIVFQSHNLIHDLTVFDNVLLPLKFAKSKDGVDRVNKLLETFEILDLAHNKPAEISGGERQRVAIARALANNPSILLADEPTSALDMDNCNIVTQAFLKANREFGTTVIIASHDLDLDNHVHTKYVLRDGQIFEGD